MPYRLASTDGTLTFDLSAVSVIVGRAPDRDLPVIDPTISRRHAEILSDENGSPCTTSDRATGRS